MVDKMSKQTLESVIGRSLTEEEYREIVSFALHELLGEKNE